MPEHDDQLPNSLTLSGADYFCWQLDGLLWRSSGKRNVCTFSVALAGHITLSELQLQLSKKPAYAWLCRLRLRQGLLFTLAKLSLDPSAELPTIHEYQLANAENDLHRFLSTNLDLKNQAGFKIDLLQAETNSILVFTWHHVLMDAHGGELFIRHLNLNDSNLPTQWLPDEAIRLPLKDRANIALAVKNFLYDISALPLLTLFKVKAPKPQTRYQVLTFTPAQTQTINAQAQTMGAGFLVSAFYLAAVTFAVAQVQAKRGTLTADVLAPVSIDRRKRGAKGPIFGNQVSFLFYRIPNAIEGNVKACTTELILQMKNLMRADSPSQYSIMMDFLRRIPTILYRHMLESPTNGLMASFFYSDTGDSLQDFQTLFGNRVINAIHYPPNMYPPGLTFVFSRCQGALQITLGFIEADLSADELELLLVSLRGALLGEVGA